MLGLIYFQVLCKDWGQGPGAFLGSGPKVPMSCKTEP